MSNHMISNTKALGYIRVSTDLQAQVPKHLERQAALIKEACASQGWQLLGIYSDVASAVGKDSLYQRPNLSDALSHAQREGLVIIVTDPTRLFRNRSHGLEFLGKHRTRVFSIKHGRFLPRKELGKEFFAGQEFAESVRHGSSVAASKRHSVPKHLPEAAKRSRLARAKKSEEIAEAIADVFEQDPSLTTLSHRELASVLNARGMRSGWGRLWNASTIRERRKRAMEIYGSRRALDSEEDVFSPVLHRSNAQARVAKLSNDQEVEVREHPNFGLF